MSRPERGRIVDGCVLDPQGRNRKCRPLVIISATEGLEPGDTFLVVCITTRLPSTLPDDHVKLPWAPGGHVRTGLDKPNAVVCSWIEEIAEEDIIAYRGVTSASEMATILEKVQRAVQEGNAPAG